MRTSAYIGRAGKVLRKILPDISDEKVQEFSMRFYDNDHKFEIRTDVTKVYECRINSCMQDKDLSFYEDNEVKVLTLVRKNEIEGRALLWENVETEDGKNTFLDRPYLLDYNDTQLFKEYAESKGWLFYEDNVYEMTYNLKNTRTDFYPYMDTMRYLSKENSTLNTADGEFCLEMDNGCLEDDQEYVFSEYYAENIYQDDAVYSQYHGDYFYRRDSHYVHNDWFHTSDIGEIIIEVEPMGELHWYEKVIFTVDYKAYPDFWVNNGKIIDIDGKYYLKEDVIKLGGNWYVKNSDDVVFCEITKRYRINRTSKFSFKE